MTRHPSRWSTAIALMIAAAPVLTAAPAALAQMPAAGQGTPGGPMAPGPLSPKGMGMPAPANMPPPPPIAEPAAAPPLAPGPAGVAAIVNGKKIYRSQVASQAISAVGSQILNTMILIELINQEAVKQHVVVTPSQVATQLAVVQQKAAAQVPGGLAAALAQRHETLDSFKQQLQTQMEAEALVEKTLPPAPAVMQYHVRHLLIATIPLGPAMMPGMKPPHTDAEALALIAKAQTELKSGKSFAAVANEYTEDPSGKGKGGDLPPFPANDTSLDRSFFQAAIALKPGQVTAAPVKSHFGYHLIELVSTSAAPGVVDKTLYTDAAAALRRQQLQTAIPAYVQNLRKNAKVLDYLGQ